MRSGTKRVVNRLIGSARPIKQTTSLLKHNHFIDILWVLPQRIFRYISAVVILCASRHRSTVHEFSIRHKTKKSCRAHIGIANCQLPCTSVDQPKQNHHAFNIVGSVYPGVYSVSTYKKLLTANRFTVYWSLFKTILLVICRHFTCGVKEFTYRSETVFFLPHEKKWTIPTENFIKQRPIAIIVYDSNYLFANFVWLHTQVAADTNSFKFYAFVVVFFSGCGTYGI